MEFLFWITVVLAVVTVVGHGLWALIALIFRLLSGNRARGETRECPFCRRRTPLRGRRCGFCGHALEDPRAEELADLAAMEREIRRLRRAEVINDTVVEALLDKVHTRRAAVHAELSGYVIPEILPDSEQAAPVRPAATPTPASPAQPAAPSQPVPTQPSPSRQAPLTHPAPGPKPVPTAKTVPPTPRQPSTAPPFTPPAPSRPTIPPAPTTVPPREKTPVQPPRTA
ncbi:MAG: hypothetical protein JW818_16895, partial [Pirellulales bacterium]|nr:hypothetical protein [Pirellulales bacterium]